MMNKKGDISIGMIITAAIALIVLVVVIAIFAGYFTGWQQSIGDESDYIKQCTATTKIYTGTDNQKYQVSGSWVPADQCKSSDANVHGSTALVSDASDYPGSVCCFKGTGTLLSDQ